MLFWHSSRAMFCKYSGNGKSMNIRIRPSVNSVLLEHLSLQYLLCVSIWVSNMPFYFHMTSCKFVAESITHASVTNCVACTLLSFFFVFFVKHTISKSCILKR